MIPPSTTTAESSGDTARSSPIQEAKLPCEIDPALDEEDFITRGLVPRLKAWVPGITVGWARTLHWLVRGCRWGLVPHPCWPIAYGAALTQACERHVVQVEATWLRFRDAWESGLDEAWRSALEKQDRLVLVALEDVNRALPECWARPLLDLVAGFRESLPVPGRPAWPRNLRILASLARDDEALPLSEEVVRHWGAVPLHPIGTANPVTPVPAGSPTYDAWNSWGNDRSKSGSCPVALDEYEFLAPAIRRDVASLYTCISGSRFSEEDRIWERAKAVRLDYARDYLSTASENE